MSEQTPPDQPEQPQHQPQQPYGQQPVYGYPQQGFPQQGYGLPVLPKHPQAQTAMVLGIIALAGSFTCLVPILLSPFAWYFGAKVKREIEAEPQRWGGQSEAQAGFIMGIIGTVLLALGIVVLIMFALFIALVAGSTSTPY